MLSIVVTLIGIFISLVLTNSDDRGRLQFSGRSILFAFIASGSLGMNSAARLDGVSNSARWVRADDVGGQSVLPLLLGLLISGVIIEAIGWRNVRFDAAKHLQFKIFAGCLLMLLFLFGFGPLPAA